MPGLGKTGPCHQPYVSTSNDGKAQLHTPQEKILGHIHVVKEFQFTIVTGASRREKLLRCSIRVSVSSARAVAGHAAKTKGRKRREGKLGLSRCHHTL
jgi:hypothetical protein